MSSSTQINDASQTGGDDGDGELRLAEKEAEEGSRTLTLFVKMITGERLDISVSKDETVETLSFIIAINHLVPVYEDEQLFLIYGGRVLNDMNIIAAYGIEHHDTIYVLVGRSKMKLLRVFRGMVTASNGMVTASNELCEGGYDVTLDQKIRKVMEAFVKCFKEESTEKQIMFLSLFTLASCADAFSMLYLSPVKKIQELGAHVIGSFYDALKSVETADLIFCTDVILPVLQFCKHLRKKDPRDALYFGFRSTLSWFLRKLFYFEMEDEVENSVTWQEIFPFVIEMGDKVMDELAASLESPSLVTPTLEVVSDFHTFLRFVLKSFLDTLNLEDPIEMPDGGLKHPYREELQSLHCLFYQLLNQMNACLHETDLVLSRREGGDNVLDKIGDGYFLLITTFNDISKIYDGAVENMWRVLEERKITLRVILKRHAVRSPYDVARIDWVLEHKQLLDFECRRHLAMMLLPDLLLGHGQKILIDRSRLFTDSYEYITQSDPENLALELSIEFKDEEATGHGVVREWLLLLCEVIFTRRNAYFISNENDHGRYHINPASKWKPEHHEYFKFCGRVITLALIHEVQIGAVLDNVLFVHLAGHDVQLEDIKYTDPMYYESCKQILDMDADLVDSDALGLTFVIEYEEAGSREVVELVPDGGSVRVNSSNREDYVKKLVRHRFQVSTFTQLAEFSKGFEDFMCDPSHLPLFFRCLNLEDLDRMLRGSESDISVEDWKRQTCYEEYKDTDTQIVWFWKIVEEMSQQERRQLLFFWTAIKYLPVEGFSGIGSRLEIHKSEKKTDHLPTCNTCCYLLRFPPYTTYEMLQQRIKIVIQEHIASSFGKL